MAMSVKSLRDVLKKRFAKQTATFGLLLRDESGQDLIEYALIFCFVMLGAVASLRSIATSVGTVFAGVGSVLTTAL